jgi:hypothetical protein
MWQKARYVNATEYPETMGRELWIRVGPPRKIPGFRFDTGLPCVACSYETNHIAPNGGVTLVNKNVIELLPEFAETVELISWSDFLKGDSH